MFFKFMRKTESVVSWLPMTCSLRLLAMLRDRGKYFSMGPAPRKEMATQMWAPEARRILPVYGSFRQSTVRLDEMPRDGCRVVFFDLR